MNEQSPERQLFKPSPQYISAANRILENLTQLSHGSEEEFDLDVHHGWEKGDASFQLTWYDTAHFTTHPDGLDIEKVILFRITPSDDDFFEIRNYLYFRDVGELQVANWLYTYEEIEALQSSSPQAQLDREDITQGFIQRMYTASDADYLDFLADLDSHKESWQS
jgi:hypothetical protein